MKAVTAYKRRWCRHCRVRIQAKPRRLCCACYATVRDLYPPPLTIDTRQHGACQTCGCYVQQTCRRCSTCKLPEPFRGLMVAALAEFERRAAEERPLFDAIRESGTIY